MSAEPRYQTIPSAPDYEAGSDGSIRRATPAPGTAPKRHVRLHATKKGYLRVSLRVDGAPRTFAAHRLTCEAFHGPPPRGAHVNHRNGDKRDNRAENLEWATPTENARHAAENGIAGGKLTPRGVRAIRRLAASGVPQCDLARAFDVSAGHVSGIVNGNERRHV